MEGQQMSSQSSPWVPEQVGTPRSIIAVPSPIPLPAGPTDTLPWDRPTGRLSR